MGIKWRRECVLTGEGPCCLEHIYSRGPPALAAFRADVRRCYSIKSLQAEPACTFENLPTLKMSVLVSARVEEPCHFSFHIRRLALGAALASFFADRVEGSLLDLDAPIHAARLHC